jgi:hypothetical protein
MKRRFILVETMLVGIVLWRLTCPALIRLRLDPLPGARHVLVLNPFLTHEARDSAETLLKLLHNKNLNEAFRRFPLLNRKQLEFDVLSPPSEWSLVDVVRGSGPSEEIVFVYLYKSKSDPDGCCNNIVFYCTRAQGSRWTVGRYSRVY